MFTELSQNLQNLDQILLNFNEISPEFHQPVIHVRAREKKYFTEFAANLPK